MYLSSQEIKKELHTYDFAGLSLPRFIALALEHTKSYVTASASLLFIFDKILANYDFAGLSLPRFTTPVLEHSKSYITASASFLFVFVKDLANYDFAGALPA